MNKKFIPFAFAASLIFAACSDDQTDVVNNGPEITFRTSVSRAQNIDETNLTEFKVWAFSDIVTSNTTAFIEGLVAKKEGTVYKFDHSIFWPSDIKTLNFWAVSPVNDNVVVKHNGEALILDSYKPAENPEDQLDIITAYQKVDRVSNNGTSVSLTFNHILSQILVSARAGYGDEIKEKRTVKVKGAWLVNIGTGATASRSTATDKNVVVWDNFSSTKASYGSYFDTPRELTSTATSFFSFDNSNVSVPQSNLLLIPQQLTKWDGTAAGNGAYILLLCRVEATHDGALHDGASDPMVKPGTDNHTHQLFPHDGAATSFNEKAYGYACVPIGTLWEYGKIYRYTLDICGKNSGAGLYPPAIPTLPGLPDTPDIIIIPTPSDKVGKPVLDEPIKFTVTVNDWTDPETWNPGDVPLQ